MNMNILLFAWCPGGAAYLEALVGAGAAVRGVVTGAQQGDRSPLALACQRLGIPLARTDDVNAADLVAAASASDLLVVAGCARILGAELRAAPRLGAINVHPSLLPAYRGREPLFWALLRGEQEVGVTVHRMTEEVDAGPILVQRRVSVPERATSASLAALVSAEGAGLVPEVLALAEARAPGTPASGPGSHVPPLRAEHGLVDFARTAVEVDRLVRAATGEIAAYTFHRGMRFIVLAGEPVSIDHGELPGCVLALDGDGLLVAAARGAYRAQRFGFLDRVEDARGLAAILGLAAGDRLSANPAF
jgi:methionyl-tRNA formyltransferase